MVDYLHSDSAKLAFCDRLYPSTGVYGYLAILDDLLLSSAVFTVDASTDVLTFTVANKLVTGSRVRITATVTIPGGILSSTDYFAIKLTTTTFKLATTLANAIAGTACNITDAGSGTLNAFEQALTVADTIAVLVAHEIVNSAYTARFPIDNLGASTIVSGDAQKGLWTKVFTNNSATSIISANRLIIYGGLATIGDITGTSNSLHTQQVTMFSGETNSFTVLFMR